MKLKRKLLDDTSGFTLIELLLVVVVFAIMIVPIYKVLVSGAKIQKTSEETYQATLQAQSVLESVKGQIEKDVSDEYKLSRGLVADPVKPWLTPSLAASNAGQFLFNFLNGKPGLTSTLISGEVDNLRKKFKTNAFLYEVHIWHMENGIIAPTPVSMVEYDTVANPGLVANPPSFGITGQMPSDFTMVEIQAAVKDYFGHYKDSLLWTKPSALDDLTVSDLAAKLDAEKLKAVGVISYDHAAEYVATNGIKLKASGMVSTIPSNFVKPYIDYEGLLPRTNIDYELHTSASDDTYEFVISDVAGSTLTENDYIYLSVDLATFPYIIPEPAGYDPATYVKENDKRILRIENKTAATVVVPMYNEKDLGVRVYPVQHKTKGNIIVERRDKRDPAKNFVIGVIVRDAFNSTFGETNKILSKIVDVYSYDYNKQ